MGFIPFISKSIEKQYKLKLEEIKNNKTTITQFTLHKFHHIVQDSQSNVGLTILMFLGEVLTFVVMLLSNLAGCFYYYSSLTFQTLLGKDQLSL